MLTTYRKEAVLRMADVRIPKYPMRRMPFSDKYVEEGIQLPQEEIDADVELQTAVEVWMRTVDELYSRHVGNSAACPPDLRGAH